MLSACVTKLLESLKGEINSTARACAAETLNDILAACYNSGAEQVEGTRLGFLCKPEEAVALTIAKVLIRHESFHFV